MIKLVSLPIIPKVKELSLRIEGRREGSEKFWGTEGTNGRECEQFPPNAMKIWYFAVKVGSPIIFEGKS